MTRTQLVEGLPRTQGALVSLYSIIWFGGTHLPSQTEAGGQEYKVIRRIHKESLATEEPASNTE